MRLVLKRYPARHRQDHLATGLAIRACQAGHRVLFAIAAQWVTRLPEALHAGGSSTSSLGSAATR
jgi:DNA replication protein DnaC